MALNQETATNLTYAIAAYTAAHPNDGVGYDDWCRLFPDVPISQVANGLILFVSLVLSDYEARLGPQATDALVERLGRLAAQTQLSP